MSYGESESLQMIFTIYLTPLAGSVFHARSESADLVSVKESSLAALTGIINFFSKSQLCTVI